MESRTARIVKGLVSPRGSTETTRRSTVISEEAASDEAWGEFYRIGDELAAKEPLKPETMTVTLLKMRR